VIQLDSDSLERVYRYHRWWGRGGCAVDQIAAFFAGSELAGAFADGAALREFARARGPALGAWRSLPRSRRKAQMERWRASAIVLLDNARRRRQGVAA
jgi:hypothetical protein